MIYVLIWILVLFISIYFFRKSAGSLSIKKLNLISILFYYSLLLSSFIGSILIVLNIDQSYIIAKMIYQESRVVGFYLVCSVMILLPLTMWMIAKLFGFQADREFDRYWNKPVEEVFTDSESQKLFYRVFLVIAFICLGSVAYVAFITLVRTGSIPIIEAVINPDAELGKLRQLAKGAITGPTIYLKNIFALALTPIISLVSYGFALTTKQKKWKLLFYPLFMGSLFIQIYDFQKAPIIFYIGSIILLRMFIGKTKFDLKKMVLISLAGVAYIVATYSASGVQGASSFLSYNSGPIGRVILTQIAPMYLYVDRYDEIYPYLEEKALPEPILSLYGIEEKRSARVLIEDVFPEKVAEGTAGVLNTLYAGEAYAGFGVTGVIVGTILLGIFIQMLYIIFIRLPKHPIILSLFIYFTINIPRAAVGGFTDILFNPLWIMVTVLILLPFVILYGWMYFKNRHEFKMKWKKT